MSYSPHSPFPVPTADERTWGALAHLSTFAGLLAPVLGHIGGPLLILLLRGEGSPFVSHHAREALNFNITMVIVSAVFGILCVVLIGLLLLPLAPVFILAWCILPIIAALRARDGAAYRYPFTLRLLPD